MFSANTTQVSSGAATSGSLWITSASNNRGEQGINNTSTSIGGPPITFPIYGVASTATASYPNLNGLTSLFIKQDGSLWAVGGNLFGELGTSYPGSTGYSYIPLFVNAGPWASCAAGIYRSAAIKSDGTLWTWGYNDQGALGLGTATINRSSPTQVGARTDWKQVAVSGNLGSMIAVRTDGTLWTWGNNTYGQLGTNNTISRSSPVQVGADTTWDKVGTGVAGSSYAIKTDGTLWSWGRNYVGLLGQNIAATINLSSPVQVGTDTDWAEVNTTLTNVYARKTTGALWSWGQNTYGEVGDNTRVNRSSPVQIRSSDVAFASGLGSVSGMFIDTSGNMWTWGYNDLNRLRDSTTTNRSSPVQVGTGNYAPYTPLALYRYEGKEPYQFASMALKTDSSMDYSLSGTSANVLRAVSYQLTIGNTSPVWSTGRDKLGGAINLSGWTAYAIKTDGSLWAWGINNIGQIPDGTVLSRSSPVQISAGSTWSKVAGGQSYGGAVRTDGTLWMWGQNDGGQLGQNNKVPRSSPVQVGALTNWAQISCSTEASPVSNPGATTMAVKTNGTLWGWGSNFNGQIGDGTGAWRSSPVQIGALTNWAQVSTNGSEVSGNPEIATLAVKTDGTLWAWGSGYWSTLGIPALTGSEYNPSPVQVGALTNWSKVSVGDKGAWAIKTDGTLWSWGYNAQGQLGIGTTAGKSSPVQIGSRTDWVDCCMGESLGIALRSDGTLWAAGWIGYINGGGNKTLYSSSPVQIGNGTTDSLTGWQSAFVLSYIGGSNILLATKA